MTFDADLNACAAMVERADPWRFRAAMAAPVETRKLLFPLYAFNVEVARAPWVTQEAMIAEMRLQWWRDALEEIAKGGPVRRHEVTTPLARALAPEDAELLDELVAARRWDIYKDPFEDAEHFARYIDQTAGHLMWVAARRLGATQEAIVRDAAYATGIAAWLCAIPNLEEAGRVPADAGVGARDERDAAFDSEIHGFSFCVGCFRVGRRTRAARCPDRRRRCGRWRRCGGAGRAAPRPRRRCAGSA